MAVFQNHQFSKFFRENFTDQSLSQQDSLIRSPLMQLNLCGREAVGYRGKNSLKTQKMHFLPVFALTSDSLTTIQVELHKWAWHQSILPTKGPNCEIFAKKSRELVILKNGHFEKSAILSSLVSRKFLGMRNITLYSVNGLCKVQIF